MSWADPDRVRLAWIRVALVRRGSGRHQYVDRRLPVRFRVTRVGAAPEEISESEVRRELLPVAQAQEPGASPQRLSELLDCIVNRIWNFPVVYANSETGEVQT